MKLLCELTVIGKCNEEVGIVEVDEGKHVSVVHGILITIQIHLLSCMHSCMHVQTGLKYASSKYECRSSYSGTYLNKLHTEKTSIIRTVCLL